MCFSIMSAKFLDISMHVGWFNRLDGESFSTAVSGYGDDITSVSRHNCKMTDSRCRGRLNRGQDGELNKQNGTVFGSGNVLSLLFLQV